MPQLVSSIYQNPEKWAIMLIKKISLVARARASREKKKSFFYFNILYICQLPAEGVIHFRSGLYSLFDWFFCLFGIFVLVFLRQV